MKSKNTVRFPGTLPYLSPCCLISFLVLYSIPKSPGFPGIILGGVDGVDGLGDVVDDDFSVGTSPGGEEYFGLDGANFGASPVTKGETAAAAAPKELPNIFANLPKNPGSFFIFSFNSSRYDCFVFFIESSKFCFDSIFSLSDLSILSKEVSADDNSLFNISMLEASSSL